MTHTYVSRRAPRRARRTIAAFAALLLATSGGVAQAGSLGTLGGIINDVKQITDQLGGQTGGGGQSGQAGQTDRTDRTAATASAGAPLQRPHPNAHHLTWDTKFTATGLADRKLLGHHFRFYCPPAPSRLTPRVIYGTDSYAFHSVLCRAAVHAGRITMDGGNFTVQMDPATELRGSTRNGITSDGGPSGIRSISFVD